MPYLEAPIDFSDSPETSASPELINVPPAAVIAQLHQQQPEAGVDVFLRPQNNPRNNSFDRDVSIYEEDNFWPAQPYLLPVVLPPVTEPNLDELLRRVTERSDLQNVDTIRLRVISYSISLSRLGVFLPRLQHLDLSGSVLSSLRDLGFDLVHLSYLNVSNCGLNSFDGTSGLPAVRVLLADGNMIQRVGPLAELPLLARLSAKNNRISDLGLLSFFGMCPNLIELDLQGNPVCRLILYRLTLERNVPSLQLLDGESLIQSTSAINNAINEVNRNNSSTDGELSSLSSDSHLEFPPPITTDSINVVTEHRPATAPSQTNVQTESRPRPASVSVTGPATSLSFGDPIGGSIILGVARYHRLRRLNANAWATTSHSSSSSSNLSTRPPSATSSSNSF